MTKLALLNAIEQLFVKVDDLNDPDTTLAVCDGLREVGIEFSDHRNIEFREDPNLADDSYVPVRYVKGYQNIANWFLEKYNAALVANGRKPISKIAA